MSARRVCGRLHRKCGMALSGMGLVASGASRVLRGVNILMVAMGVPGEGAGWRLAQFGARVTRVEPELGPSSSREGSEDPLAVWCPRAYQDLVEGHRVVRTRLEGSKGRPSAVLESLLEESHVLVEALRPATREAAGLGRAELSERFPGLGVVRLVGPRPESEAERRLPGYSDAEVGLWASAGLMNACEPGGGNMPPALLADMAGALMLSEAAFAAAVTRLTAGRGRGGASDPSCWEFTGSDAAASTSPQTLEGGSYREVSLEGAGRWMALPREPWGMTDPVTGCHGGAHAGYRVYKTLDGRQVAWSALDQDAALQLCSAAECALPGTLGTLDGVSLKARVFKHMLHAHTHRAIQDFCATRTASELMTFAAGEGLNLRVLPRRT